MSFWDSSGLVPLCTNEPRSILAVKFWKRFPTKFVWWETSVEISSALARLERENKISFAQRLKAEKRLATLEKIWEEIQPSARVKELARTSRFEGGGQSATRGGTCLVQGKPEGQAFCFGR